MKKIWSKLASKLAPKLAFCLLATGLGISPASALTHKLMLLSIDGLDWRYLRDRDALGMKIPNLRQLLARSRYADGVVGVWPTITWPSHTSMLTGQVPDRHGILANAAGVPDPALSYWSYAKIKLPTLTQCVRQRGGTVGAVHWPVTVDAPANWNLPEVYARRNGDSSDMDTVARYATPGLMDELIRAYPSFNEEWFDDRPKVQAVTYILKNKHPDLMLVHLAELDSAEHNEAPFTPHAKAVLERTDELIGEMLKALPKDYDLALVSDHGFEQVDHIAQLKVMAAAAGVTGPLTVAGGLVTTTDANVATWLRAQSGEGDVGREIAHDELVTYAPASSAAVAAFEPAPHVQFGNASSGEARTKPGEKGNHGFWPTRPDYHSIYLLSGPGVTPGKLGEIQMVSLEKRLEAVIGISCGF
ncbi:MAG TPA: ectonucleotide pyrophosphatase/phosphodiesterase [Bryobacteraceae bacterium]|nr:ectonucleotide pyrophosphatase/phosphodiesterase [Bryobacteraceae bacterium]